MTGVRTGLALAFVVSSCNTQYRVSKPSFLPQETGFTGAFGS